MEIPAHTNILLKILVDILRRFPGIEYAILVFCITQGSYTRFKDIFVRINHCNFEIRWQLLEVVQRYLLLLREKSSELFFVIFTFLLSYEKKIRKTFLAL